MTGLSIDHLRIRRSGRLILDSGRLDLGCRGAVALIGPNGAGKSSLLKALAGGDRDYQGRISWEGRDLKALPGKERARLIGYVPQNFEPCWNQSVAELLELAASRTLTPREAWQEASRNFELVDFRSRRWSSLSGGERARVLLAMAMTGRPPLLLADEPGAALDIGHQLHMIETFIALGAESLVVVCLHDLETALRHFERVILLKAGRVEFFGPTETLKNDLRLDEAFEVDFQRLETEAGFFIRARAH